MKLTLIALLLCLPIVALAEPAESPLALEKASINLKDNAAILRGAKFYAKNCMVCHSMKYVRHNKLAAKAGITLDKMPLKNKSWWLNIVPTDLSLIASQKGADWLYTYFHAFYKDSSRPTGYNNLVAKNVNMTNVFAAFQGEQVVVPAYRKELVAVGLAKPHYYSVLRLVRQGAMTPAQFDQTMTDLVNFLVYVSEPHAAFREWLGIWVILFLLVFAVIAYFLKKSYWKDV